MTRTPARALLAGVLPFGAALIGAALVAVVATGPAPGATATALALAVLVAVAVAVRRSAVAPVRRAGVARRGPLHDESLAESCCAAHPDAAGHVRSRAPGSLASTA